MKFLIGTYIFCLINVQNLYAAKLFSFSNDSQKNELSLSVERIFGSQGVKLSYKDQQEISQLLHKIDASPYYVLYQVSKQTESFLKEHLHKIIQSIDHLKEKNKEIPYALLFMRFCIKQYMFHLNQYRSSFSFLKRFTFHLQSSINNNAQAVDALSKELYSYFILELSNILIDYTKTLTFLTIREQAPLPSLMDAWTEKVMQERLKKRSKHLSYQIKLQFFGAEMVVSMSLQAGILAGGGLSIRFIEQQDQEFYKELTRKQQAIATEWEIFRNKLQKDQKESLKLISTTFAQTQQKLIKAYSQNSKELQQALAYLNQSINLAQPINHYLTNPIAWDRYFESAAMYTPLAKFQPWFNIFGPFNTSNWLFIPEINSFCQLSTSPIPNQFFWQQPHDKKNIFINDPGSYSIFTEWATDKQTYDIEIDCSITHINYPFFVGIIFNRARWISGDPERLWAYRAYGIYSANESISKEKDVKVGFAQQILQFTQESSQASEKIISPLEQIMSINNEQNSTLKLPSNPLNYTFKISNSDRKVTLTLLNKNEPAKPLWQKTIDKLDQSIFRYHGIGFISAGCQAQFTIKKPSELTYSPDVIENFIKKETINPQKKNR